MRKFFVQQMSPDGEVSLSVNTANQIVEMMGFRDCTDCDFEVFSGNEFGKVVKLEYIPSVEAPHNLHIFKDPTTGEDVIKGYSTEH
mgnify:CR=1 FL=1